MKIHFYKLRPKGHPFPIFSWLIMLCQGMNPFSKNAFSHMALGFMPIMGYAQVSDVNFSGFRTTPRINFFEKYKMVDVKTREFKITEQELDAWLESHRGKEYDFSQIFGLMVKEMGFKDKNFAGSDLDRLVCNELLLSFLIKFDKLVVLDSDNWDLNMTWDEI